MSKQPKEYLKHILDEIEYLETSSADLEEEVFMHSETLQRAFARSVGIIGEATKKLPKDFTKRYPGVDWKLMAGMRDKLIHDYFGVDYAIVWDVVKNEIPQLKTKVEEIVREVED